MRLDPLRAAPWCAGLLTALHAVVPAPALAQARAVAAPSLVYHAPVWPAAPVGTPPLAVRGAARPAAHVVTPPLAQAGIGASGALTLLLLVYRGPTWPGSALATAALVFDGASPAARQVLPAEPKLREPRVASLLGPLPRSP